MSNKQLITPLLPGLIDHTVRLIGAKLTMLSMVCGNVRFPGLMHCRPRCCTGLQGAACPVLAQLLQWPLAVAQPSQGMQASPCAGMPCTHLLLLQQVPCAQPALQRQALQQLLLRLLLLPELLVRHKQGVGVRQGCSAIHVHGGRQRLLLRVLLQQVKG